MRPIDRPTFAKAFPKEPALDALVEAFARGDYARVRGDAKKLIASAPDGDVRSAARTLRARTSADPLAIWLLALAGALLLTLSGYWIVNGRAPPNDPTHGPPLERGR
jgi:hypothetical protein